MIKWNKTQSVYQSHWLHWLKSNFDLQPKLFVAHSSLHYSHVLSFRLISFSIRSNKEMRSSVGNAIRRSTRSVAIRSTKVCLLFRSVPLDHLQVHPFPFVERKYTKVSTDIKTNLAPSFVRFTFSFAHSLFIDWFRQTMETWKFVEDAAPNERTPNPSWPQRATSAFRPNRTFSSWKNIVRAVKTPATRQLLDQSISLSACW